MAKFPFYSYFCFVICASLWFYGYYFRTSIGPIADILEHEFETTATGIGLINSLYYVFYASSQIPWGIAIQYISPKIIAITSAFFFTIVLILFAFSNGIVMACILSAGAGLFSGPAFLALLKLTENEWFNTEYIPFMIGIQVFLGYGLLVVFQIIQAWVYERFNDWQVTYYFFAGLCFISFIIFVIIFIYDYYKANMMYDNIEDEDPQLVLTRIKNGEYSSTKRSISYSMSKKRSSLFRDDTNTELNQKLSTKYKYAVKNIQNWLLITWGFCGLMIVNGVYGLWMINYLMVKFGYSRSISASINGTYYIARAVVAPIVGKLSIRFQKRKIFLIVGALLWTSTLYIIYGPNTMSIPTVISMNIISGIGASVWGIMWTLSREYNNYYNCKDVASGLTNCCTNIAGFVAQFLIGDLIDVSWKLRGGGFESENDREYIEDDYNFAFIVVPISIAVGFIASLFLKETHGVSLDENYYHKTPILISKEEPILTSNDDNDITPK